MVAWDIGTYINTIIAAPMIRLTTNFTRRPFSSRSRAASRASRSSSADALVPACVALADPLADPPADGMPCRVPAAYPASLTAASSDPPASSDASATTCAFSVARLTDTLLTPGTSASTDSTLRTHEAQVIPSIGSVKSSRVDSSKFLICIFWVMKYLLNSARTRRVLPGFHYIDVASRGRLHHFFFEGISKPLRALS